MQTREITIPELGLIASTRGMLGAGIGLLVAERLNDSQRRAVGWTLIAVGVLTTIPIAAHLFGKKPSSLRSGSSGSASRSESELIGQGTSL